MTHGRIIPWNSVIYRDCMDTEYGLPSLPDKSIEYCITDPPYNVNLKKKNKINYEDNKKNYKNWCENWFQEIKRTCKYTIIQCGFVNLPMWCNIEQPYDILYSESAGSPSRAAYINHLNPILIYNKLPIIFDCNPLKLKYKNRNLKHSCPINERLWDFLFRKLRPKTVLDPFMGSGTTAEYSIKYSSQYIGYEIEEKYKIEVEKRIWKTKKEPKQVTLI